MTDVTIHVLLVEDDKNDREDFLEAFKSLKLTTEVTTMSNVIELMQYLNQKSFYVPHILFLNLNMAKKSGLQFLKEIRNTERLKNLTAVTYSTFSSEKDLQYTFLNGANIYIKKPAHLTVLKKVLLQVLTINWQYQTSGLNRDNFLLQL